MRSREVTQSSDSDLPALDQQLHPARPTLQRFGARTRTELLGRTQQRATDRITLHESEMASETQEHSICNWRSEPRRIETLTGARLF